MPTYADPKAVQRLVLTQIAGLAGRPDVVALVAHGPAELNDVVGRLEALKLAQERAKCALVAATLELRRFAAEARALANANIAAVQLAGGKYSPDLRVVGAKPLSGRRGPAAPPPIPSSPGAPVLP